MNKTMINIVTLVLLGMFVSACTMFSPVKLEQPEKFLLKDTPKMHKYNKHSTIILVAPVTSYLLYDTDRMAYSIDPYVIDYFVKNEWAMTPSKMIQPLIIKTLSATNYYKGVMSLPSYANYHLILAVQLQELRQLFYQGQSYYQIKMKADLIQPKTARLIASKEFVNLTRVDENNPRSGVYAANNALKKLLKELTLFSIKNS